MINHVNVATNCIPIYCAREGRAGPRDTSGRGYELCKDQHLLALQEDGPVITRALRSPLMVRELV